MKKNPQKKLTRAQQKVIDKLVKSQEVVKRYLMFNGADTQAHWIPPLDYAEEHTNSAAQARVLRLAKCLLFNEIFYIAKKGKEPDLYKRYMTEFDRYIISHTSIGLMRSEDGKYTQNETLPLVVPMIFTQKKYDMADIKFDRPYPIISVTKADGITERIEIDKDVQYRMIVVLQYLGSFEVPCTDECIGIIVNIKEGIGGYILFTMKCKKYSESKYNFVYVSLSIYEDLYNIYKDIFVKDNEIFIKGYINSYVDNPPIRENKEKN